MMNDTDQTRTVDATATLAAQLLSIADNPHNAFDWGTEGALRRIAAELDDLALDVRNHAMIKDATSKPAYADEQSIKSYRDSTTKLLTISEKLGNNRDGDED